MPVPFRSHFSGIIQNAKPVLVGLGGVAISLLAMSDSHAQNDWALRAERAGTQKVFRVMGDVRDAQSDQKSIRALLEVMSIKGAITTQPDGLRHQAN